MTVTLHSTQLHCIVSVVRWVGGVDSEARTNGMKAKFRFVNDWTKAVSLLLSMNEGKGIGDQSEESRTTGNSGRLTYPFKCLPFPFHLVFGMTINKSQGQTMTICGLDLENPCFSHGQLIIRGMSELVEGKERLEVSDHPQSVLPLNWGGTEPNRTVNWMVLKATVNDRRHLALCYDEFREPRSSL
ncbi:uncharacterized protein TNCV_1751651 [Trichonephila clavipes]|nr:uncharacterized protein TNCV_1751651 [Trichonephila clavipes]